MPVSHKYKIIFVHIPKTAGTSIEAALGMHGETSDIGIVPQRRQKMNFDHLFGCGLQHITLGEIEDIFKNSNFRDYSHNGRIKHNLDIVMNFIGIRKLASESIFSPKTFVEYLKFAVVRNPYDRLVSHFAWLKKHNIILNRYDRLISRFARPRVESQINSYIDKEEFTFFVNKVYSKELFKTDLKHGGHLTPQYKFIMLDNKVGVDRVLRFERLQHDYSELCKDLDINIELPERMVSGHENFDAYYDEETRKKVYLMYQNDFEMFDYYK